MDSSDAQFWLNQLEDQATGDLAVFIPQVEERLKAELMQQAAQIHTAMEAWHHRGVAAQVTSLFRQIDRKLSMLAGRQRSWLQKIWQDMRSYIAEPDEEADGLNRNHWQELEKLHQAACTYQQRMKELASAHANSLQSYIAWITALTRRNNDTVGTTFHAGQQDIIRKSTEFLSAQEELAATLRLQQQSLQLMLSDLVYISTMTKSLVTSTQITAQVLQQYQPQLQRLREYSQTNKK